MGKFEFAEWKSLPVLIVFVLDAPIKMLQPRFKLGCFRVLDGLCGGGRSLRLSEAL